MSSEIMSAYWATPPIARTLATAIFVTSVLARVKLISGYWILFHESFLFAFPPQVWRLVTNFLIAGPGLGIIMDPYFTFQYMRQLETSNPKFLRREDLIWYLITVGGFTMLISRAIMGSGVFFLGGLIIALAYTANQDQRGVKTNFLFFTVPAQAVPYCMLCITVLIDPPSIWVEISGLLAAHLHDFLTRLWPEFGGGRNWLATPGFVSWLVKTPRVLQRRYGTAVNTSGSRSTGTGGGAGGDENPVLPDLWRTRGSGHRLGGN